MRLFITLFSLTLAACAQSQLTTPAVVHPNAAHTVGGEVRVMAPNDTEYFSVLTTANGSILTGKAANNGNIVLVPGDVATKAAVYLLPPRLDTPSFIIQDPTGTTTSKSIRLITFGGVEYFSITQGTDATSPGLLSTHSLRPLGTADQIGAGTGSGTAYFKFWGEHGDFRQTDDSAPSLYASTFSSTFQPAIFAESITGSGAAGRFSARATSTGPAVYATSANASPAIHAVFGGITDDTMGGGGVQTVCVDNVGHMSTGGGCGGSSPPFIDTTNIVKGSADATKLLRFEVDGFTTGTTRTLTPQNANYTIAGTDITNLFTQNQQFNQYVQFTKAGVMQFQETASLTGNLLEWFDSSSALTMTLDTSGGTPGGGKILTTPSIVSAASNTTTITLAALATGGQTADVFDVFSSGLSKYLAVSASGAVSASSLAGGGIQCLHASNAGVVTGVGVDCGGSTPSAWTAYTPSTTNLTSVSATGAYQQHGKDIFVRFSIGGRTTAGGAYPLIGLPVNATAANTQILTCIINAVGGEGSAWGEIGTSDVLVGLYNNTALAPSTPYGFTCEGVYEST